MILFILLRSFDLFIVLTFHNVLMIDDVSIVEMLWKVDAMNELRGFGKMLT